MQRIELVLPEKHRLHQRRRAADGREECRGGDPRGRDFCLERLQRFEIGAITCLSTIDIEETVDGHPAFAIWS